MKGYRLPPKIGGYRPKPSSKEYPVDPKTGKPRPPKGKGGGSK